MNTHTDRFLDVTVLEPRAKHPTIFSMFNELGIGESLTISNDHDPKPLYYQMLGELGNIFTWEYLENGPDRWQVKITRKDNASKDETLGDIAAKDIRKAEVFRKFGLDFCCGGNKTLREACAEKNINFGLVQQELQAANVSTALPAHQFNEWNLDFLADYIVNTHHAFTKKQLPVLVSFAQKVASVHGASHPELNTVREHVEALETEMNAHMAKEERVLFPYIKSLVQAGQGGQITVNCGFGTVRNPIRVMLSEHEHAGGLLHEIRSLTKDYTLPADACNSYRFLFSSLDAFEQDLHVHIHLENNILFPKAIALEDQVNPVS